MKKEIWKDVPGWVGFYQVSNRGRVRSCYRKIIIRNPQGALRPRTFRARILNPFGLNYFMVSFTRPQFSRKYFYVHELVAMAFLGPRPPAKEICHNNGNPKDNSLENLRYGTRKENAEDCTRHGRRFYFKAHESPNCKLSRKQVLEIRKSKQTQRALAAKFGVGHGTIGAIRRGERYWR